MDSAEHAWMVCVHMTSHAWLEDMLSLHACVHALSMQNSTLQNSVQAWNRTWCKYCDGKGQWF